MKFLLLGALFVLSSCGVIKGSSNATVDKGIKIADKMYPQDNAIEERVEDMIEATTGLKTDLSPATPEE